MTTKDKCAVIYSDMGIPIPKTLMILDYEWSPLFLWDSRTSKTRAPVKITPREKGETRQGERKIPEEKWELLVVYNDIGISFSIP